MLTIYNTLHRKKVTFEPIDPNNIRMYVCGPTVYDRLHIGNARPIVIFDVLYKTLKMSYPNVLYVRNITDVDDKINARAQQNNESIQSLTLRTTDYFHDDISPLNCAAPDFEPKATEHIPEMIMLISQLIARGHAYEAEKHVLFNINSMPKYGELSKKSLDDMIAGARVEVAPYKKNPGDFILWKPSEKGFPGWPSPWGHGRPGWHIECSAMSLKYLGPSFDIHGGGEDLIFPHHENEIAQSCCAQAGSQFAKYWMHNGHLIVNGQKMSKSLGNFLTLKDLNKQYHGEVLRFTLLSSHYRQPLDFTQEACRRAKQTLDQFYTSIRSIKIPRNMNEKITFSTLKNDFLDALHDDLNTPLCISILHKISNQLNKETNIGKKQILGQTLLFCGRCLNILEDSVDNWFKWESSSSSKQANRITEEEIEAFIIKRKMARYERNFKIADKIRNDLLQKGIILEDHPTKGTLWKRQTSS